MKLDTENIDDDDGAFMQIAFDDHPDGIELEYREGVDTPLYHCRRPVLRLEAENALLDYLDGIDTWKYRFEWEEVKGVGGSIRRFVPGPVLFVALLVAAVAGVIYIGKLPRNMRILPVAAVIASLLAEGGPRLSPLWERRTRNTHVCARRTGRLYKGERGGVVMLPVGGVANSNDQFQ